MKKFVCLVGSLLALMSCGKTPSINLAKNNINETFTTRGSYKCPQADSLPKEVEDVLVTTIKKNFNQDSKGHSRLRIAFNDEVENCSTKKGGVWDVLYLHSEYFSCVMNYILSQGLVYDDDVITRTPYWQKDVDIKLPITNGKLYSSAVDYWKELGLSNSKINGLLNPYLYKTIEGSLLVGYKKA